MAEIVSIFEFLFFFFIIHLSSPSSSLETDTITSTTLLRDPDTIVSPHNLFKFGFFTPDAASPRRYAGVFYAASETTVAWVANRERPLPDSSGAATISKDGNFVLLDSSNQTIWSTNATATAATTATALKILDTGNLVLLDAATGATLWESFAHPSNVFLPTMKISDNIKTNKKVVLTSWKTAGDPSVGSFTFGIEAQGVPQQFLRKEGGGPVWRSGPWNGLIYLGIQDMYRFYVGGFSILTNDSSGNFEYTIPPQEIPMHSFLNSTGNIRRVIWDDGIKSWRKFWSAPEKECDLYGKCGPFGICDDGASPVCSCLRGFEPRSVEQWRRDDWSGGCTRKKGLQCGGDGFLKVEFVKVPDFCEAVSGLEEDECRSRCLGNCSCLGYAHDSNIGCMFWDDDMIDVERFDGVGVHLFLRLSSSELEGGKDKKLYIIIPVVVFGCVSVFVCFAWRWMVKRKGEANKVRDIFGGKISSSSSGNVMLVNDETNKVNTGELPQFTFEMLANATDQFNEINLLGRGGFGPVYKGYLSNGKEVAVKRLSADSGQGLQEFMNEVTVMSKLQHRNLVRLIGGCVEKEERILIYEYMPNKSLDFCLFDDAHSWQKSLDWKRRFTVIEGVARGLLYLHRDSRLRIIHRDLKPSNVLLDEDWNPKISDFGMARIFGGNQDYYNTTRVVGTLRYMAPEYAMEGRFSEKSDVYSFGVLMLEIVKGKRITNYYSVEWNLSLLGCAWKLWSEGNGLKFSDESIASPDFEEDIVRCIHIALLCVQDSAEDRPTIPTVVSMLSRETARLPSPKHPLFAEKWSGFTAEVGCSVNELTLTVLEGR